jgi:alpha-L-rhamnosidase
MLKLLTMVFIMSLSIQLFALETKTENASFTSAQPVWLEGRETEMNLFAGFQAKLDLNTSRPLTIRITGSSLYRVFVNGKFIGHGPARGPHGFYRLDEWIVDEPLLSGDNIVAVEVAGYNANSFYLLDQPSFLQAEVEQSEKIIASTAGDGQQFVATQITERLQKVQRYSFQRPFIEVYQQDTNSDLWRTSGSNFQTSPLTIVEQKNIIARGVPYPRFDKRPVVRHVFSGTIRPKSGKIKLWRDRSLVHISEKLKGYPLKELDVVISDELQRLESEAGEIVNSGWQADSNLALETNTFHIVDFGKNLTGFLGGTISCSQPSRLVFTFDELLINGDVDFKRLGCVNAVSYELEPGTYDLESFEPYTARYLKIICLSGDAQIENIYLREMAYPDVYQAQFSCSDPTINTIFEAARETFRQNTVDIFMDCPSRERAGWLCDSFFTSRVAFDLSGETKVERNFFENYLLPPSFKHLPEGMLPMCYPADHYDGVFIPNWALWFVVELGEFAERSEDEKLVQALKNKVYNLFDYFKKFENQDGLLEKLESWVFVEWSDANKFVQDVNYPSNMLYAATLEIAGKLYQDESLIQKAKKIKRTILQQSFSGNFFVDNAVRKNGRLEITDNTTEVCQYYAFYFSLATPESHPKLWQKLITEFGPIRESKNRYPNVNKANAFIGNYLRLELLSRRGFVDQLLAESKSFFYGMAERTGTLWEHTDERASCNHGFASHVAHLFYRDVLGLYKVDRKNKAITLRFADIDLEWCNGRLPGKDGFIHLDWIKRDGKIFYQLECPSGYDVKVENISGLDVLPKF